MNDGLVISLDFDTTKAQVKQRKLNRDMEVSELKAKNIAKNIEKLNAELEKEKSLQADIKDAINAQLEESKQLEKHIENLQKYGVPVVVTLNAFVTDTEAEINFVRDFCTERNCEFALSEVWEKGGEGGIELAKKVIETLETKESKFAPLYEDSLSLKEKVAKIATEIYGAKDVSFAPAAAKALKNIEDLGFGSLPVCMAKTQYSFSDDMTKLGAPEGFTVTVRNVKVSAGAGFIVALTGDIMTMPGLPKSPAALRIDVDEDGKISGLF